MENIVIDRSGTMVSGYFYELCVLMTDDSVSLEHSYEPEDDIVSLCLPSDSKPGETQERDYVSARIEEISGADNTFDCPVDRTHRTASVWKNVTVQLSGGPDYSDLIYGDLDASRTLLVPERMAKRLLASPFRGYHLAEILDVDYSRVTNHSLTAKNFRIFELQFRGRACRRGFSVLGAPNACPHCGRSPLICPGCGQDEMICPNCGNGAWIGKKNHKGSTDKQLIAADWSQMSPMVIDVNRWDGSDFIFVTLDVGIQTNVVTKRVVDWLLSLPAAPFVARPVQARLDGASAEQLRMLDEIRGME